MKKFTLFGVIFLFISTLAFSQVAINSDGSSPHPSAGLDINFVNKGLLLPRMTFDQVTAIQDPAEGLIIFCTDCSTEATGALTIFQGGSWKVFNIDCTSPSLPLEGTHVSALNQITWTWSEVPIAVGYKFNTVNDFFTATDLGQVTSFTETNLDCWTPYSRYIWSYNSCGYSQALLLQDTTLSDVFSPAPTPAFQIPTAYNITWSWFAVSGALGYKWNTINDPNTAIDLPGGSTVVYLETGLNCLTNYTRYLWSYDDCGLSSVVVLNQTTSSEAPASPAAGNHVADITQVQWKWNTVANADGYKWNTVDNPGTAIDLGLQTSYTESGLTCNTAYTRYVWAYTECGTSIVSSLTKSTLTDPPAAPVAANHIATAVQITWKWRQVPGADGYKWSTTNNYATAIEMGTDTSRLEIGLICNTSYNRYVWAYSECGVSNPVTLTRTTELNPPASPVAATHVPTPSQIQWKWRTVAAADGYKFNVTNNYATATEIGTDTAWTEAGLNCNTSYTRYVWAFNECGVSSVSNLNQSTSLNPPSAPVAATHIPAANQVTWRWNAVSGATGYKFNTTNDLGSAQDVGNVISYSETNLTCNTSYTRYVWAYSTCGTSAGTSLSQATSLDPPSPPTAGTHFPTVDQIVWNWNTVTGATGYKFNTTNDYNTAQDLSTATTITESNLSCNSSYTRYVWAYSSCGVSTIGTLNQATTTDPPAPPTAAAHVATPVQITWKWFQVADATGYKWNTTNNYESAINLNTDTSWVEFGLTCNSSYTRYIWAYSPCGISSITTLTQSTALDPPAAPAAATHTPTPTQITWNWSTVSGAVGYKWNTTNNYGSAQDMGTSTSKTETGLICNTSYTRYIWAYSNCGVSTQTALTQATSLDPPAAPVAGTHVPSPEQIVWNWNTVPGATGYKFNTTNNYGSATDLGSITTFTETGLTCNTSYNRYVWAYSNCGVSNIATLTQQTALDPPASPIAGVHVPAANQVTWKWNAVTDATGYRWNTENNLSTSTDLGNVLETTETGLLCNTAYTRYVWAYSPCGTSVVTSISQTTALDPPDAPLAGTHVASGTQIAWNWNVVADATGYKWSTTNVYSSAADMGANTTYTETGLSCNTSFTRYVWAYSNCGVSGPLTISQQTTNDPPAAPALATNVPDPTQIQWKWRTVPGATGYKWSATNDYANATNVNGDTTFTQTGLTCNTSYTSYVWAYNACAGSSARTLTQLTALDPPDAPLAATHNPALQQIVWNWNTVAEATGYKWNTTNDYGSATDMGANTTYTETGLTCYTSYTRYVWAYGTCGVSAAGTLTASTIQDPPPSPVAGTHTATGYSVTWNWNTVSGATGYKWSITNDYATATDLGNNISFNETGLACNTSFTRYVWAYSTCGFSAPTALTQSTTTGGTEAPVAATHTATVNQIVWNWNTVSGATGYKWSTTDNYTGAEDMGNSTSRTQTGLVCNTSYTAYVWAYNACGNSISTSMTHSTTLVTPATPTAATHVAGLDQITWDWNTVSGATGYKWSTTNNFSTAIDMGTNTAYTETGLVCGTSYTRYVWAYNECTNSSARTLTKSTTACFVCGNTINKSHVVGDVAPVNKTTTYGTVTNVPGETTKCWITSNLGSDHQATSSTDATEASAGWYWQFNKKQGYKHDGTTRTPNTTWVDYYIEASDWVAANDPCALELGNGWRLPTRFEWINVDAAGGWGANTGPWNSLLKLHMGGRLNSSDGTLANRGSNGVFWSSNQSLDEVSWRLNFNTGLCSVSTISKSNAYTLRCIKD